jgi:AcrR family transcriptional regulator
MAEAPALRERRRIQTALEVADAALGLFERDGVEATRVEAIAAAAGISNRTFFRYFASKEHAAFALEPAVEQAVEGAIAALDSESPLLPQLETMQRDAIRALGSVNGSSGRRELRVWRLMQSEPALAQTAAGIRNDRVCELAGRIRNAVGATVDELELELTLGLWEATATAAYVHWAAQAMAGHPVELMDSYERAILLLRTLPSR